MQVGDVRMSRGLHDMFLSEARLHLSTLRRELARMRDNPSLQPADETIRAAPHPGRHIRRSRDEGGARSGALPGACAEPAHRQRAGADCRPVGNPQRVRLSVLEGMVAAVANKRRPQPLPELIEWLNAIAPATAPAPAPVEEIVGLEEQERRTAGSGPGRACRIARAVEPAEPVVAVDPVEAAEPAEVAEAVEPVEAVEAAIALPSASPPAVSEPPSRTRSGDRTEERRKLRLAGRHRSAVAAHLPRRGERPHGRDRRGSRALARRAGQCRRSACSSPACCTHSRAVRAWPVPWRWAKWCTAWRRASRNPWASDPVTPQFFEDFDHSLDRASVLLDQLRAGPVVAPVEQDGGRRRCHASRRGADGGIRRRGSRRPRHAARAR